MSPYYVIYYLGIADVFLPARNIKTWKRVCVKDVFSQGYHHPPQKDMFPPQLGNANVFAARNIISHRARV